MVWNKETKKRAKLAIRYWSSTHDDTALELLRAAVEEIEHQAERARKAKARETKLREWLNEAVRSRRGGKP